MSSQESLQPHSFTPDGRELIYFTASGFDSHLLSVETGESRVLVAGDFITSRADLSSDGRWLAHTSNESGSNQVLVRPFPDVTADKWQVSTTGGNSPAWSADGSELFYVAGGALMAVEIDTSKSSSSSLTASTRTSSPVPTPLWCHHGRPRRCGRRPPPGDA